MTQEPPPKGPASYFPSIEKTYGYPIDHWMTILAGMPDKTHMQMVTTLKTDHKLGHGHANALVAYYRSQKESEA